MRTALNLGALAGLAVPLAAQAPTGVEFSIEGHVNKPEQLPANPADLVLPDGYSLSVAARDLGNARILAAADDGTVYVTRRAEGDVLMLRDGNGDGMYESRHRVASRPGMHGIALDGDTVFLVTIKDVYSAPILSDGSFGDLTTIVDDLPDAGQHPNRTIAIGPDNMLYVSVGSTCNACAEDNPENATIVRMAKDGSKRMIYASGLRNTIGFDWHPRTGALWGFDHGIDWLGDEQQPEELNQIVEGGRYGWPYVWGEGSANPQDEPPNGLTMAEWAEMSRPMVLGHTAHAAPMQLVFNRGTGFPADVQGDAFATMRGSWNRADPSGYDVVRVRFGRGGQPTAIEPFLGGFLTAGTQGHAWTGRPTGLTFAPDGSLLVGDSENGVLYRVRYNGRAAARPLGMRRPDADDAQPGPIAIERPETRTQSRLEVRSDAFMNGAALPPRFSAYYDNASPPLSWSGAPAGTRSFALIVDDPDAGEPRPFTHWTAWNIPASVQELREGMPGAVQLGDPQGMRQGADSNNRTGWYGMRPPVGDTPHSYHFQIFALDTMLDLLPGATREQLLGAMNGHVLASGELAGTYSQPAAPTD